MRPEDGVNKGSTRDIHKKREAPQLICPVLSTLSILHSTQPVGLALHDVFDCRLDNDDDDDGEVVISMSVNYPQYVETCPRTVE